MEVKTKYGLGDKVYYVADCAVKSLIIGEIGITKDGIVYRDGRWSVVSLREDNVFTSKEELVEFILNNEPQTTDGTN